MNIGGCGLNTSQLAANLFTKLDTKNQGYVDKDELQSAFDALSTSGDSSSTNVDAVFTQLDSDGDGKITQSELSDSIQTLADSLMSQLHQSRMQGMGDMPPPPPPPDDGSDEGFTQDELTSMASDLSSTDSKRANLMSTLAANFEAADTDGNGKISREEAMNFDQSQNATSSTSSSAAASQIDSATSTASTSTDEDLNLKIMLQIMQLLQSYGASDTASKTGSGTLSVAA